MTRFDEITFVRQALQSLTKTFGTTHHALTEAIIAPSQPPSHEQIRHLSTALDHLGQVREGFIFSQRATKRSDAAELRYMAQQILIDWAWLEELQISLKPDTHVERLADQLIAYRHALVVLGFLPQLPEDAITFPQIQTTYFDIRPPGRPSQMLERIEEIERTLYQASITAIEDLARDSVRRTFAFFEAAVWVINHHLTPLLAD